jgi:hypothetical protein
MICAPLLQEVAQGLLMRVSGCTSQADRTAFYKEWLSFRLEGLPETHHSILTDLTERCTEGEGIKSVSSWSGSCQAPNLYYLGSLPLPAGFCQAPNPWYYLGSLPWPASDLLG